MKLRKRWIGAMVVVGAVGVVYSARSAVARTKPCAVVPYSFDGEPFTFEHTYSSGSVGPFTVGQKRSEAFAAVTSQGLPVAKSSDEWRVAVKACSETHAHYTATFAKGRLQKVKLFVSAFEGL